MSRHVHLALTNTAFGVTFHATDHCNELLFASKHSLLDFIKNTCVPALISNSAFADARSRIYNFIGNYVNRWGRRVLNHAHDIREVCL